MHIHISATVPLGTSAFVDPVPFCLPCPHVICLLSYLTSNLMYTSKLIRADHPKILLDSRELARNGGPLGEPKSSKSIKIPTSFRYPQKSRKSEPRVTKSLPK